MTAIRQGEKSCSEPHDNIWRIHWFYWVCNFAIKKLENFF
jgi:hypothetical protein